MVVNCAHLRPFPLGDLYILTGCPRAILALALPHFLTSRRLHCCNVNTKNQHLPQ
ncbi:hypothetical protein K474DRAFT_1426711 [Panus rudis PR-1116 ss-1]|nr:hypothetical protein K474DRAFT_1426711 [Panus rudis PR-1116 ss-1]